MPPVCAECGHPWMAHLDPDLPFFLDSEPPCSECEDLLFYDDITPEKACNGYFPAAKKAA